VPHFWGGFGGLRNGILVIGLIQRRKAKAVSFSGKDLFDLLERRGQTKGSPAGQDQDGILLGSYL